MPRLTLVAILSMLGGCAHASAPTAAAPHHHALQLFCMHDVASLAVREVDLHDGAELRFAAAPSERHELVERVERFVTLEEAARAGNGPRFGAPDALLHHARLSAVEDADGVELVAETDDAHVDAVRAELREDAVELAHATCPAALQVEL